MEKGRNMDLSGIGIWDQQLRTGDPGEVTDAAAELESLGYSALWIHDVGGDVFGALRHLLEATRTVTVATGILNLWMHPAEEAAARRAELVAAHGPRLMLGIGVSHAPIVDAIEPGRFKNPIETMNAYLDGLDAVSEPVPAGERMLAALRPRMIELAGRRTRGAFPYNMTPEHTARAREILGPAGLLATEQKVVLERDPATARAAGRKHLAMYFGLPNYVNAWRWLGFTDDDLADGGSDRLVDAVVAWGDEDAIARRIADHRAAGADHVCIQALAEDMKAARATWQELAPVLL
jgi:probable F420-dependent oxidoreductase